MRYILEPIFLVILFAGNLTAQSATASVTNWDITICPVKLLSAAPEFDYQFNYVVTTDRSGKMVQLRDINGPHKYVDTSVFKTCFESWILGPSDHHFVAFRVATRAVPPKNNYIYISTDSIKLRIMLPRPSAESTK